MRVNCRDCGVNLVIDERTEYAECPNCGTILVDRKMETLHRPWE